MGKPNIQSLEDHLLGSMQPFRGLLEYSEDIVEVYQPRCRSRRIEDPG